MNAPGGTGGSGARFVISASGIAAWLVCSGRQPGERRSASARSREPGGTLDPRFPTPFSAAKQRGPAST